MITVITKYDGHTADYYVAILKGRLTPEQRRELQDRFECDLQDDEDDGDASNMFFREFDTDGNFPTYDEAIDSLTLYNVDGENIEPVNPFSKDEEED